MGDVTPDPAEAAYDRWSARHGGLDPRPSWWTSGWVRLTDGLAGPPARWGVSPTAVTAAGVLVVAAAPLVGLAGGGWLLVAVLPVVLGAVLDGVDGAVASRTGRETAWGRVLDPLADRVSDLLLLWLLVVAGAPALLGVALAVLTLLLEGVRSSAQAAGMRGPGGVTVWERPSRVLVACFGAGGAAVAHLAGVDVPAAAGVAWVGLVLAVAGSAQLLVAVRRQV